MAGDWIKMDVGLPEKPEVWQIAGMVGIEADSVVGKLLKVWRWFDAHTESGNAVGVTYALVDHVSGVTGFGEAMALCGWLAQDGATLSLPNFDRHNGKTAKNRALTAKRVASFKEKGNAVGNASSVSSALPREEKNREEVKQEQKQPRVTAQPAPDDVDPQTWADWLALRKAKRAPVSQTVIREARKEAAKAGMAFGQFLAVWCRRGSQGLEADWLKPNERIGASPPQASKTLTAIQTLQGMKHGNLDSRRDSGRPEPAALPFDGSDASR